MAYSNYDPEIWFILRKAWESFPKITWEDLCRFVSKGLKKDTPSARTVAKRAKAEKWKKNIRKYCQKSSRSLEEQYEHIQADLINEYIEFKEKNVEKDGPKNAVHVHINNSTLDMLNNIASKNRKTIDVVNEHRGRASRIGQLLDESMQWLYEAKTAAFMPGLDEVELKEAQRKYGMVCDMAETIESFSRTAERVAKIDYLFYGMTTDDTKQAVTSDRISRIKDESAFLRAKEDLQKQFQIMSDRARYIHSGEFEQEVAEEMERKMREEEEAIEAEYQDIEEDEICD